MRVTRILDNDFKRLLLGSMSCVRFEQDGDIMQYLMISLKMQTFLPRIG